MTVRTARHASVFAEGDTATMKQQSEQHTAVELIKVLRPHSAGLRRWSVMRAMRAKREATGRSIPLKFEDDIERVFRRLCGDPVQPETQNDAVFFRPQERAGEVWAVYPERADAWLDACGLDS